MDLWQLLLIVGTLVAVLISFIWVAIRLGSATKGPGMNPKDTAQASVNAAVNQAFTEEFREELRQRASKQFEAIIHENAMFLQQDVRMSAAQLNDFMKKEVVATLQQEMGKHHETLNQTKQLVTENIAKTETQLKAELTQEKERRLKYLDEHMGDIVKNYVVAAVGDTIDVDRQLAFVLDNLNANKASILEDIRQHG